MAGKDGKVEVTSSMNVTQEDWDKIFGKKEEKKDYSKYSWADV